MTCAKVVVTCTIIAATGERFVGRNDCANPQPVCPRLPGEDYRKCIAICRQAGHAEEVAVKLAGSKSINAVAYIEGHHRICENCESVLQNAFVAAAHLAPPPKE